MNLLTKIRKMFKKRARPPFINYFYVNTTYLNQVVNCLFAQHYPNYKLELYKSDSYFNHFTLLISKDNEFVESHLDHVDILLREDADEINRVLKCVFDKATKVLDAKIEQKRLKEAYIEMVVPQLKGGANEIR